MFNPLGMAVGFLVADSRNVKDPLLPALVGGMLPMPMGPIAAVVLADSSPATTAVAPAKPDPRAIERAIDAAYERLRGAGKKGAVEALRFGAGIAGTIDKLGEPERSTLGAKLERLIGYALSLLSGSNPPPPEEGGGEEIAKRRRS